jgi:hypothetical protein
VNPVSAYAASSKSDSVGETPQVQAGNVMSDGKDA